MKHLSIELLNASNEQKYKEFISSHPARSIYNSLKYKNFLEISIENSNAKYILGLVDNKVELILPIFIKKGAFGSIANSLPFFGSHGGLIHSQRCPIELCVSAFKFLDEMCSANDVVTSIIVEPIFWQAEVNLSLYGFAEVDERIGQVSDIPRFDNEAIDERLFQTMHSKTRNMVRKAQKQSFEIVINNSTNSMALLHSLHEQNMSNIGGKAKPIEIFKNIKSCFSPTQDFDIFIARKAGNVAAMLLLLYEGNTVEYFTPVINDGYRSSQPLSATIFEAMKTSSRRGFKYWNWGGTWLSQTGVYRFKSRWGAKDRPYRYWLKKYSGSENIMQQPASTLIKEYPYFYTKPF